MTFEVDDNRLSCFIPPRNCTANQKKNRRLTTMLVFYITQLRSNSCFIQARRKPQQGPGKYFCLTSLGRKSLIFFKMAHFGVGLLYIFERRLDLQTSLGPGNL